MRQVGLMGLVLVAALASGCSQDPRASDRTAWGCGDMPGAEGLMGRDAPRWVVIGEATESREGPEAAAELACHLASAGDTIWFGRADFRQMTDAEQAMEARLEALAARGAPIVVGLFDPPLFDSPSAERRSRSSRTESEKARAQAIEARVRAAGADRAVLFTSAADAALGPFQSNGERFAGYDPMPMHLEGGVVSLMVRRSDATGAALRRVQLMDDLHSDLSDGMNGELNVASLTRPAVEVLAAAKRASTASVPGQKSSDPVSTFADMERGLRRKAFADLRYQFSPGMSNEQFRELYWAREQQVLKQLSEAHHLLFGQVRLDQLTADERAAWEAITPKAPVAITPVEAQQRADATYRVFTEEWQAQGKAIDTQLPAIPVAPVIIFPEFTVEN